MSKFKKAISSLAFNIISSVFILILLFSIVIGSVGYVSFTDALKREYKTTTYYMANTAATLVNGDKISNYLNGIDLEDYKTSYQYLKNYCNSMDATMIHVFTFEDNDYSKGKNIFDAINDRDINEGTYTEWTLGSDYIPKAEYINVYDKVFKRKLDYGVVFRKTNLTSGTTPHVVTIVPITDSENNVLALLSVQRPMSELVNGRRPYIITILVSTVITLTVMVVAAGLYIKYRFTKPIEEIAEETRRFAKENKKGDFSETKKSKIFEINELSIAIDKMEDDMVKYINDLTEATMAQKKTMVELNIAKGIQGASIPNSFPAFPDRTDFDLFAYMLPAKEVGGDFYNFILIDENHLGLVMADVSGKGVPAALFMMVSNILLSERLRAFDKPSEALLFLNNRICAHNTANMFVTIWVGVLDLTTGKIVACNAGHDDPVICRKKEKFELFETKHDLAVGAFEDAVYNDYEIQLEKGDKLFLYTDGVVEATNKKDELFGFDRMLETLNANKNKAPNEIIKNVKTKVDAFANGREQFDDITMLCFELKDN